MMLELLTHLEVSAASALVQWGGFLYVVADDGLELLRTDFDGLNGRRIALSDSERISHLPKKVKPDFEALMISGDELVAIGSGSTPARCGAIAYRPQRESLRTVDLTPLYATLSSHLHELNIEGAVVRGNEVLLAQRGNGARRENALVRLDRSLFIQELAAGELTDACLKEILPVTLGELDGVSLSLTDFAVGPRAEVIFTAAAEATQNPYDDGVVAGSVVGLIDHQNGHLERRVNIPGVKLEGVCWLETGELRLVADPDDPTARAPLFRLEWT